MIERPLYVDKIMAYVDTPFVKILTGVRRCGKSTILKMIMERLKTERNIPEDRIISCRFDSMEYEDIWTAKQKARELADRTAAALTDRTGQGTLDVAITVLISIVLGALILAGLYLIVDDTVLPTITQRIKDMFNYGG